ncbi:MAG TPA: hypothetical protein VE084_20270 [Burkholderiaceae bacterium]|nr:hypothetical protein [Burkholderiaceae bacterium]
MSTPTAQLDAVSAALTALRKGTGRIAALSDTARASEALLGALPARYREVLLNLLDRLESSALFSEESCSFSQKDLLDSLQMWVDKARAQL